jgi:hypothetical protein
LGKKPNNCGSPSNDGHNDFLDFKAFLAKESSYYYAVLINCSTLKQLTPRSVRILTMAAPGRSIETILEALFRPSTRFRDSNRNRPNHLPQHLTEIELLPHLTLEDVLATGITWDDFWLFLESKVVWMTLDVYVCSQYTQIYDRVVLRIGDDEDTSLFVYVMQGKAAALATATCDCMLRLLATCEKHAVCVEGSSDEESTPISGAGLSLFFIESQSCLRHVTFDSMALSGDLCHALATMSRLDVELDLRHCSLVDNDAAEAFVECLQSDRGPVELERCRIDCHVLASALVGNSRVTRLRPDFHWTRTLDTGKGMVFRSLTENKGLVDLDLSGHSIIDENWSVLCEALHGHPTLTSLDLEYTSSRAHNGARIALSTDQRAQRTRAIAELTEVNTILLTVVLADGERDEKIYTQEIIPYLETNLYRPRVLAVKKTIERPFREKVLGRALGCVKSNPNLVWMFLSRNVDAFVRSEEREEEASDSDIPVAVAVEVAVEVAVAVAGSTKRKR